MGTPDTSRLTAPALDASLVDWLDANATQLDTSAALKAEIVPRLAAAGLFRTGVPASLGGAGGTTADAIAGIAAVAEHSLTAAFVLWGQRSFIEYLLQSPNTALRERWLPALLDGRCAGASGLSNAMKYLSGIESLQIDATPHAERADGWRMTGRMAWVTNLRAERFVVAAAVAFGDGRPAAIVAIPDDAPGLTRSPDLDLIALRGSNTAALHLDAVPGDAAWLIHPDAQTFLSAVRPAFLGLQCGLSIGLARRSLAEARRAAETTRGILGPEVASCAADLVATCAQLSAGIADGSLRLHPDRLFALRIALATHVATAVNLELEASGGRGYLRDAGLGFERRWREAAFIPIVTPSVVQLKAQLAARTRSIAA
ncbi:acyl-CoA/acyl-ACP dehydrogenase [Burkholderia cenocepacia]|uniref:acyl-CoA dehydrogenase family protein n=1 Tax=Burkholderia cenocepacia TaxID=95486 RepID=UPI001B9A6B2A|nr:acyl-CoA dehydrogenase family protein [Burkholderia cenocepacia]MBR8039820.1 acyl-CoA/acyl-ACP dehydrogenase [Burkholderia cenocepacia]MBR8411484.1 acyl-CoA/acyl-ACP dehydrogenase [Burkholderia cenocepacia]